MFIHTIMFFTCFLLDFSQNTILYLEVIHNTLVHVLMAGRLSLSNSDERRARTGEIFQVATSFLKEKYSSEDIEENKSQKVRICNVFKSLSYEVCTWYSYEDNNSTIYMLLRNLNTIKWSYIYIWTTQQWTRTSDISLTIPPRWYYDF